MVQYTEAAITQQRIFIDRRIQPTSFWNTLRLRGRRRSFRRLSEGMNQFVDCPAPTVIALAVGVTIGSALDALLTLLYIANGGGEANPFMAMALAQGDMTFISIKMSLTCVGAWALSALQQFPLANRILHGLALMYVGLLGLHMLIWLTS